MTNALGAWVAWAGEVLVDDEGPLTHLPDAATTLVFRTTPDQGSDLTVIGPRTGASYHPGKDVPFCVRVRIRPGRARPLLGVPVSEIVNDAVPIGRLWGPCGDRLVRDLVRLGPDARSVIERLDEALIDRLARQTPDDLRRSDLLHAATRAMADRPEPVRALARRVAVSERHLRDLFTDGLGIPPKRFARIDRVRRVLAGAHQGADGAWARLAADAGYYDQSHMTADFRSLMGVSPAAFAAGRLPPAQAC